MNLFSSQRAPVFTVSFIKQGIAEEGLGEEMYAAFKQGTEMPIAIEFTEQDSPKDMDMKNLILLMTSYHPEDRPSSTYAFRHANVIYTRREPKQKVKGFLFFFFSFFYLTRTSR